MAPQPSPIGFVVVGNTTSPHESLDAAPLQPCTVGDSLAALFTLCPELARLATGSLDKPEDCTLPIWICLRYGLQLLHPDEAQDWNVEIGLHYYNPSMLASAIHSVITSDLFDADRKYTASALASCMVKCKNKLIAAAGSVIPDAFVAKVEHLLHVSIALTDGSEDAATADARLAAGIDASKEFHAAAAKIVAAWTYEQMVDADGSWLTLSFATPIIWPYLTRAQRMANQS